MDDEGGRIMRLVEANNRELERRRVAEQRIRELEVTVLALQRALVEQKGLADERS